MESRAALAATGLLARVLCQVVFDIDTFGQHVGNAMAAVVRGEVIVFIEKGTGANPGGYGTLGRVIKANQLALHHAPIHHFVELIRTHQVAVQQDHLF